MKHLLLVFVSHTDGPQAHYFGWFFEIVSFVTKLFYRDKSLGEDKRLSLPVSFGSCLLNGPGLVSYHEGTNPRPVVRPLLSCISFAMLSILEVKYMAGWPAKDDPWL